jgi:pimeloyl-ACP methyl ester carboxylesterase
VAAGLRGRGGRAGAELARFAMPVLAVAAGQSRQNDAAALLAAARILPDAATLLIPAATHFSVLSDQPERQLNPALADLQG